MKPAWFPDWSGAYATIVAGGPSLKGMKLDVLRNRIRMIVINESYRLAPWADVLYGCEAPWWNLRQKETAQFKGIRVGYEPPTLVHYKQKIERIEIKRKPNWRDHQDWYVHEFIFDPLGTVGSGQNSGFQAINLAAQFGVKGIALLGFDMKMSPDVHWHGRHPSPPLRNPDYDRFTIWREHLTKNAPLLAARGIDVVNCCTDSGLEVFPKMKVDAMLERWGL